MAGENLQTRSVLGKANDPFLNQVIQAIFNDLMSLSSAIANITPGSSLKNNYRATTPPAATDDSNSGYTVTADNASRWYDTVTGFEWIMQDDTPNAAVWGAVVGNPNP